MEHSSGVTSLSLLILVEFLYGANHRTYIKDGHDWKCPITHVTMTILTIGSIEYLSAYLSRENLVADHFFHSTNEFHILKRHMIFVFQRKSSSIYYK